jgi:cell division septation protein DedD
MAHSQEPSYYEIALTNRQVLGFFVVLLVCVVGAFFSGVWLGQKRDSGRTPVVPAEVVAEAVEPEGELEELNFFTDAETPPASVEKAAPREQPVPPPVQAAGPPDTTLLEDVLGDDTPSETKEAERKAQRAAAVEPPVRTSAPVASAVAPVVKGLVVQVLASPNGDRAQQLLGDLKESGYQAFLSSTRVNGQTMHRVRIGPFEDRSQAEAVKRRVDKAYQVSSFITTNE